MSKSVDYVGLRLDTIGGGALQEQFDEQLKKVIEDINDPNKEATAARTLTVKITMKPDFERENVKIAHDVTVKLPAHRKGESTAILHRDNKGRNRLFASNLRQQGFTFEEDAAQEGDENVIGMADKIGGGK